MRKGPDKSVREALNAEQINFSTSAIKKTAKMLGGVARLAAWMNVNSATTYDWLRGNRSPKKPFLAHCLSLKETDAAVIFAQRVDGLKALLEQIRLDVEPYALKQISKDNDYPPHLLQISVLVSFLEKYHRFIKEQGEQ
jgi:hypothetical protein